MKVINKLRLGLLPIIIITFLSNLFYINVFAAGSDNEYRNVLDEINNEYGLEIGYGSVDINEVSLEEYKAYVEQVAIQQKELKELIDNRSSFDSDERINQFRGTRTVSKAVWGVYDDSFKIQATFDVNGMIISNPRDFSIQRTLLAIIGQEYFDPNQGSPTSAIIDSGRTLAVTYVGTYHAHSSGGSVVLTNITMYTEFYYTD